jgi:hypothetical protein
LITKIAAAVTNPRMPDMIQSPVTLKDGKSRSPRMAK